MSHEQLTFVTLCLLVLSSVGFGILGRLWFAVYRLLGTVLANQTILKEQLNLLQLSSDGAWSAVQAQLAGVTVQRDTLQVQLARLETRAEMIADDLARRLACETSAGPVGPAAETSQEGG